MAFVSVLFLLFDCRWPRKILHMQRRTGSLDSVNPFSGRGRLKLYKKSRTKRMSSSHDRCNIWGKGESTSKMPFYKHISMAAPDDWLNGARLAASRSGELFSFFSCSSSVGSAYPCAAKEQASGRSSRLSRRTALGPRTRIFLNGYYL